MPLKVLIRISVRGAKPRAKMGLARIEPGLSDEKWRISADTITVASACCTCVPGVLPQLRSGRGNRRSRDTADDALRRAEGGGTARLAVAPPRARPIGGRAHGLPSC